VSGNNLQTCFEASCQSQRYDKTPYDTLFTFVQKVTNSQLSLPHGTNQKRVMKKIKTNSL